MLREIAVGLEQDSSQGDAGSVDGITRAVVGDRAHALVQQLYPICRSITGDGVRETLRIIQEVIRIEIHEVPTGTQAFDWEVPKEWRISDAFIANTDGRRVVDFRDSNLHVVSYSTPVNEVMRLADLRPRLHSLPEHPEWIPYRTSYYNEDWGFCLTHRQLESLQDDEYQVVIHSELFDGSLTYGELLLPGESDDEILLFAHCCHPSLCNDNLSGLVVVALLGDILSNVALKHSIRIVLAPATIGSIVWMSQNESKLPRIKAGVVASVLGDAGHYRYKVSRRGDAVIDRACRHVLQQSGVEHEFLAFSPWGYDERQFCSPGVNLPVGRFTRTPNGEYREYHTSADDCDFVRPECLAESVSMLLNVIECLENDRTYRNMKPCGEPQLGRRGLFGKMGGFQDIEDTRLAMLWMLNQSDGERSVLDIAETSGMSHRVLADAAKLLLETDLLREVA